MTEKELGDALLRLDAAQLAGVPDARQQTWRVLERDRRRVRLLTGVTVAIWLLATALILLDLVWFGLIFPAQANALKYKEAGKLTQAEHEQVQEDLAKAFKIGTVVIGLSVAVLTLATLSTVLLLFASRRATLRQVNASLAEISEQLRQLRQAPGK